MIAESTSTEPETTTAPTPPIAAPKSPYDRWAEIFTRALEETHAVALALEVLDGVRAIESADPQPIVDDARRILTVVASIFSVPVKRLHERNRRRDLANARYVAAFLLRRRLWTTQKTGALFGLDHSTIVTGLQKVENTPRLLVAVAKAEHFLGPISVEVGQ